LNKKSTHIKRSNQSTANIREGKIRWIVYNKMKIKGREKGKKIKDKKGSEKPGREKRLQSLKQAEATGS
jgi:hypothetical protein